jgi:hypothetical protein
LKHLQADQLRDIAKGRVLDHMHVTHKLIRELAYQAYNASALIQPDKLPGRIAHGGGGKGTANATTFANFMIAGPTSIRQKKKTSIETQLSAKRNEVLEALATTPFHL